MSLSVNVRRDMGVCLALALTTLALYGRTVGFGYVIFDDDIYIFENLLVSNGLTFEGLVWAFTESHAGFWMPLTWLSHMLDCQLFGARPGWHHLTSVLLHVGNALLVYLVLKRMTAAVWRSAFVAAVFAVHPLNVDPVAWTSERKELLCLFFGMLAVWSYVRYVERPRAVRYLAVMVLFMMSLMSKPMTVTLPCVLLLIDYWPLSRVRWGRLRESDAGAEDGRRTAGPISLVIEKIPLFAISFLSCAVAWTVHNVSSLQALSFGHRLMNATISCAMYIRNLFWPSGLTVMYPYRDVIHPWHATAAGALLVVVTIAVVLQCRRRRYLLVGWLWFLGTLVPVIGLVSHGFQAMADHYTYLPHIGLLIALSWGLADLFAWWRAGPRLVGVAAAGALGILFVCSWIHLPHYADSQAMFNRALAVTQNNWLMHTNLGWSLYREGAYDDAATQFKRALEIRPGTSKAQVGMGAVLYRQEKVGEAIEYFTGAVEDDPTDADALNNLGLALTRIGKYTEAEKYFSLAVEFDPRHVKAHTNWGDALREQSRFADAAVRYARVIQLKPGDAAAHSHWGDVLAMQGEYAEAAAHYARSIESVPDHAMTHRHMGDVLTQLGKHAKAVIHYARSIEIAPNEVRTHINMAYALMRLRRFDVAVKHYGRALQLDPSDPSLLRSIEQACEMTGWQNADVLRIRTEAHAATQRVDQGQEDHRRAVAISHPPEE